MYVDLADTARINTSVALALSSVCFLIVYTASFVERINAACCAAVCFDNDLH